MCFIFTLLQLHVHKGGKYDLQTGGGYNYKSRIPKPKTGLWIRIHFLWIWIQQFF